MAEAPDDKQLDKWLDELLSGTTTKGIHWGSVKAIDKYWRKRGCGNLGTWFYLNQSDDILFQSRDKTINILFKYQEPHSTETTQTERTHFSRCVFTVRKLITDTTFTIPNVYKEIKKPDGKIDKDALELVNNQAEEKVANVFIDYVINILNEYNLSPHRI